jgi:hypothetical protein
LEIFEAGVEKCVDGSGPRDRSGLWNQITCRYACSCREYSSSFPNILNLLKDSACGGDGVQPQIGRSWETKQKVQIKAYVFRDLLLFHVLRFATWTALVPPAFACNYS